MTEYHAKGNKPQPPDDRSAEPYRDGAVEKEPPKLKLQSGEQLLFSPPNLTSSRRPVASLGQFKTGEPALHFRIYRRRGEGVYNITGDGASFTLAEFDVIVRRVRELCKHSPEMAIATWGREYD